MVDLIIKLIPKKYLPYIRRRIYARLGWNPNTMEMLDDAMKTGYKMGLKDGK